MNWNHGDSKVQRGLSWFELVKRVKRPSRGHQLLSAAAQCLLFLKRKPPLNIPDTPFTPKLLLYEKSRDREKYCNRTVSSWNHKIIKLKNYFWMFFRQDMTARTWGTAPFARGSSWCCGWKEWSSQWPLLTWGSKHPSSGTNTSWASGRRDFHTNHC